MGNKSTRDSDVSFIQALAEVLRENDLTEVQVKREYGEADSLNVRVSRQQQQTVVQATAPAAVAAPFAAAPAAETPVATSAPAAGASDDPASHPGAVTSPMVGTVYMSPEPGAAAFISAGATVYFLMDMGKKKIRYDDLGFGENYNELWNSVLVSRNYAIVSGATTAIFTGAAVIIGTRKIEMPSGNEVSVTPQGTLDSASLTLNYHF